MNEQRQNRFRILAVDDESDILELYKLILCPDDPVDGLSSPPPGEERLPFSMVPEFELTCCFQGDEAVKAVDTSMKEKRPFAVVFLDLIMPPGPDGAWTAKQIQKLDPSTNIVAVTAYYGTDLSDIAPGSTIPDSLLYLQKPFHWQEILQFANVLSTKWQAERQLLALHSEMESLVEKRTAALSDTNKQLKIEIEHRQQAQKALHMSEINFRNMINNNADGILILDEDSIVRFMNPAAQTIFGNGGNHVIGRKFDYSIHTGNTMELNIHGDNGKAIVAEMRVMKTEWGGKQAYLASLRDITERKRMQQKLQQSYNNLKEVMNGTIRAMALTVEMRDPYTSGHQQRVADFAAAIAGELDLPPDQIEGVYMAAAIHDIGKISLPAEILSKPIQLTELEVKMIQTHSQAGYDILKGIDFPWPIAQMVLQHHERMDGSGYPRGLSAKEILLGARIICVADVVETMASHRPYRPSVGIDKALEEITKNNGLLYDPKVVDACLRLLTEKGFEFPKF
ncbi:MAG: HD domain-containing protein [Desulfobacterales bacterium]|nr:MAG: HD domain-containing protein [Desulfobacterales bacterium]